jgi:glycosyltransferase involved in cell wall biosynthesis
MLLQSEFPPDIRLEKEISALTFANFEVILLCNSYKKESYPKYNFGKIIRIPSWFKSPKLNKVLNFPLFLNPRLMYYSIKVVLQERPDFIHVHDLPMFPIGYLLKKVFKKKLILDLHENYPAALRAFKKSGIINLVFKNPHLAEKLEKYSVKKADRVITVIEENQARLVNDYCVSEQKCFVVSNTVDLKTFAKNPIDENIFKQYENKFVILYAGWVSPERGLETPILGMKYVIEEIPNAVLLIVGNGISVEPLKKLAKDNSVNDCINFIPWVGHEKINSYMKLAKIGIITHPVEDFINTTITHKLFEYMSQNLAVVLSESEPFKRIMKETNAGLVFHSESPKDFADKIILLSNSNVNFGENGRLAIENKFNWSIDSNKLINMYQNLT